MNFLEKLQNLPEAKRKIILWISIIILTLFLFGWYLELTKKILENANSQKLFKEELKLPALQQKMRSFFEELKPEEKDLKDIESSLKEIFQEAEKQIEKENSKFKMQNDKSKM